MKVALRLLALIVLIAAVLFWYAKGANRGWTKNKVRVQVVDEVTGITGPGPEQKKFVPGLDFLSLAVGGAFVLAASSFLFRTKKTEKKLNHQT
ncbi:MAG TPA: hypothetical protein VIV82_13185 [Verrucomicrobiae bacterium]